MANKREWNNSTKYSREEFFPTIFVKPTNFQLVFNFEQTCKVAIFGNHGIMARIHVHHDG